MSDAKTTAERYVRQRGANAAEDVESIVLDFPRGTPGRRFWEEVLEEVLRLVEPTG